MVVVCPLRLAVHLRVEPVGQADRHSKGGTECFPDGGRELGTPVEDCVKGNAKLPEDPLHTRSRSCPAGLIDKRYYHFGHYYSEMNKGIQNAI